LSQHTVTGVDTKHSPVCLTFHDNSLLPSLYGEHDSHLAIIEHALGVEIGSRGNTVAIQGKPLACESARSVLQHMYQKLERGIQMTEKEVHASLKMASKSGESREAKELLEENDQIEIRTRKKVIRPYTNRQADYIRMLRRSAVSFALGPAGTGKTYVAVAAAVEMFINGKVDRIILSRPAVEAGERLGFLPGDLKDKVDPYLRPLYDALHDMLPADKVLEYMENGTIEIAPLAFMRGRTLSNAYVILDEAQNSTPVQMKMFLTRLGEHSRMLVTGDMSQTDLPRSQRSGLRDAVERLEGVEGIGLLRFGQDDVVRHPLAARIIKAYEDPQQELQFNDGDKDNDG
jgi:phosphate starvation-inducible PhoH-like protein